MHRFRNTSIPTQSSRRLQQPSTGTTLYGDVNCDKLVDIMDVIALNKYILGTGKVTDQGKVNADVDQNDKVDTTDSLNILKCVVELQTLPVK